MKEVTARRIAKEIEDDPSDRLVDAIIDLVENRNQTHEYVEEVAEEVKSADQFYIKVAQEVLLDGTSPEGLREINENLKEKLDDLD